MISWSVFCDAPGRAIDLLNRQDRVYIRAGNVELCLSRLGLASDKPHKLTVGVRDLRDGRERTRADVRAALERGEAVKLSRFGWAEAVIERVT